jgi:hypothetical protein
VSEPDHAELQQAVINFLARQPTSELRLHVQVKPFERATWPPDSTEFTSELFLMVSVVTRDGGDMLQVALSHVRQGVENGEIALPGCRITEFTEGGIFNEADSELGSIRVLPIRVKVESENRAA